MTFALVTSGHARLPVLTSCLPLSRGLLGSVAVAVGHAWSDVQADYSEGLLPLGNKPEDTITERLANLLEALLYATPPVHAGYTRSVFSAVTRGEAKPNYNGASIAKQPDLMFRLASTDPHLSRYHGIYAEAKVIPPTGSFARAYGTQGVLRFVRGDYAWTASDALMLGYQIGHRRAQADLDACLLAAPLGLIQNGAKAVRNALVPGGKTWPTSQHARAWTYPLTQACPGNIRVWHLWRLCLV